ncbi:SDR family oxidoreductase [Arthrobacter sp. zg-Y20]|uniref:SDR family oxidoreductase n=1 Tax=unclassified Arthrobacter TaxID=235627 RepID=UPI001D14AB9A|nr:MULTISPECIES: SDR family oxidoreductase [unclassified Arthrobacter]MCC3275002.1 SDR family oxidoreductase [Arthrobacter sp. zg-Y20]MDK1315159.1 SDR family oxidoreductase [Arthrobacter sp. zg.Y20]WIB04999.1 SDR family oxidoreductase [Arthrobacter sp. zg-Y20]
MLRTTSAGPNTPGTALVAGATGIAGAALVELLTREGWQVLALSRKGGSPDPSRPGVVPVAADLTSPASLAAALKDARPTHVFFTSWSRQETEVENIAVNAGMVRNLLAALEDAPLEHVALMTGLKHYMGPFEAYGEGPMPDTPFSEEEPRLPVDNFYYAQEDELMAAAQRQGFAWSVHRSHTVIGFAVGNAMNMGQTLAVQATLCKELGLPFIFPGSETQWNSITDMTDAGLLAEHMLWAATDPNTANEAYNVVNGDVFRWRSLWPRLAAEFGVTPEGFDTAPRPLEEQMAGMEEAWKELAVRHGLAETDITRLASWWHTDADLGRNVEVLTDMSKSRLAGFTGYRRTEDAFKELFARLRDEKLIP